MMLSGNDCAFAFAKSLLSKLQYVGLAQGIQGTFVAISAIPGTLHRSLSGLQWFCAVECHVSQLIDVTLHSLHSLLQLAG